MSKYLAVKATISTKMHTRKTPTFDLVVNVVKAENNLVSIINFRCYMQLHLKHIDLIFVFIFKYKLCNKQIMFQCDNKQ